MSIDLTITTPDPDARTFTRDARGRWRMAIGIDLNEPVTEAEVIDILRRQPNWRELRALHFPMEGFHS